MTTSEEVAERYAAAKPGLRLLSCDDAALPMYWLTLDALVQERKPIPALEEYVLRTIGAGLDTVANISGVLGVEEPLVERAITSLWARDYVDYPAVQGRGRSLQLTDAGRRALEELVLEKPQRRELWIAWDRILWAPLVLRRAALMPPREVRDLEVVEIRPAKQKRPDTTDLNLDALDKLFKEAAAGAHARDSVDVLGVSRVIRAERMFLPVHLLVYQSVEGRECEVGIAVDGRWSERHDAAIAALGGVEFLGLALEAPAGESVDLSGLPLGEVERVRSVAVPLAEVERIRTRTANVLREAEALAFEEPADSAPKEVVPAKATEDQLGRERDALESLPVREIDTFEHAILFEQFRKTVRRRLLIVSPWVSASVVTKQFLNDLRRLARKDVSIRIGFGIDDKRLTTERDRAAERELLQLSKESANIVVKRLGDTHAKVLVADDNLIVGSFNWLSFRGDQGRAYRQERGILVKMKPTVDASYEEHRLRIEAAAQ